ncbi:MAG TPA: MBL fold metallo-hydrolase [Terriglobales bacterium]|nr:MBL fold metallo-hydrolase [Terriglobales bacterium]
MKIKVVGAAGGEVTGSAYYVQTKDAKVLVDAGMFQGGKKSEAKNRLPSAVNLSKLDSLLLTHAHLDHTGRVPLLIKHGYSGRIFATAATIELAELILQDSARLQVHEAERANRRRNFSQQGPVEPLYSPEDVVPFRQMAQPVQFREPVEVAKGISARWIEAGHILGSASIELTVKEDGRSWTVLFSGDLGPIGRPIIRDFERPNRADIVFLESTYGDRDHRSYSDTVAEFEDLVKRATEARGKILVPTFAIGRAQLMLYHLATMFHRGVVRPFHVYLDSPMAIEASKEIVTHPELFDEELLEWKSRGLLPLDKAWFHASVTAHDSQSLNGVEGPCLILAGAGMCNGGRILHHLRHGLPRDNTHVLIVGYQTQGSLGRRLVERAKSVSVFGEKISVRAKVNTLGGFSAHAGQSDLLKWFTPLAPSRPRIIITHGEDAPRKALAEIIYQRFGLQPQLPSQGSTIEISEPVSASHALAS